MPTVADVRCEHWYRWSGTLPVRLHNNEFLQALGHLARVRGMAQVSRNAGLDRNSLYKALSPGANPRADTQFRVIRALRVRLHVEVA